MTAPGARIADITPRRGLLDLGLRELWNARELLLRFAVRSLTLRYRQTALGITWVALQPLLTSGVLALVFGRFAGLSSGSTPYLLTVYAGLLPWILISQAIQRGGMSLVSDRNLVTKTAIPRMTLPLASILAVAIDLAVALVLFALLAGACGIVPGPRYALLPALLLPVLALSAGATLIAAGLNVYYRDVQQAIPFLLQIAFFVSPIAYPAQRVTEPWASIMRINPLLGQVEAFRWALLGSAGFPRAAFLTSCAVSCLVLGVGLIAFRRVERALADVI